MSDHNERIATFAITGGIFGVGRLATRLTALATTKQIGEWHIGHWLDWKHTAIRIKFATETDATLAKSTCSEAAPL